MMRLMNAAAPVLFAVLAATLGAQSPAPFTLPDGVDWRRDIIYSRPAPGRELKADLFLPESGSGPWPAIVFIHGGGWRNGNKQAFRRQAAHLATRGFVGLCIEYRLSGEAKWPAAYDDAQAAVKYLRDNFRALRVDPNRIAAAGGSAGGHLAALLGTNPNLRLIAVAAFNPALDLITLGGDAQGARNSIIDFLGSRYPDAPDLWIAASPARQVSARSAKFLFLHGTKDETVPYSQSIQMAEALRKLGVTAELFTAEGAGHGFFNRDPWFAPTLERMQTFFETYLSVRSH